MEDHPAQVEWSENLEFRKPNRELSVPEIIDRSFGLYSRRFLEFLAPFLVAGIINGVIRWAVGYIFPPIAPPTELTEKFFEWLMSYLGPFIASTSVLWVSFWIISTIANGIVVKYASDLLEKGEANLANAFDLAIHKLASLLVAGLVSGILMILGVICFIIPGIIVAIMFSLVVPVIMIEDKGPLESLEMSRRLVDKSWWKIFGVLFLVLLLAGILTVIGEALNPYLPPLGDLTSTLISALIQPIYPIALTYLYYSMRTKEAAPSISYVQPAPTEVAEQPPRVFEQPNFCIYCGQSLPRSSIYCPNCGSKIQRPL